MMGVPIDGPTNAFYDNKSVVTNSTLPQSTLSKKYNSMAYHRARKFDASNAIMIAHEKGKFNLSDVLTKALGKTAFYQ